MDVVPPLTGHTVLTRWEFAPVVTGGVALAAVLYLVGVRLVARRHPVRPWPKRFTAAFLLGLLAIVIATQSSIGAYDDTLFWIHMVQHLLLIMVAPVLLVVGRPVTLLLHACRNPVHRWALGVVRSRPVALLTHPLVGLIAYTATIVGTHLTSFMNTVVTDQAAHDAEHALYLIVGYLFFLPVVGREPLRWRLAPPVRALLLILAMPADTFTGLTLTFAGHEQFPAYADQHRQWGPTLLGDLHGGGAVMWIGGDFLMFGLVLVIFAMWSRSDSQRDVLGRWLTLAHLQTLSDRTGGGVVVPSGQRAEQTEEQQLAAYNAYLARLHAHETAEREAQPPLR